jgi:hypothetical protein
MGLARAYEVKKIYSPGLTSPSGTAWVELLLTQQNKVKQPPRKSRAVRGGCCCIGNRHHEHLISHDTHYATVHHSSMATRPWCQGALSLQLPGENFKMIERGAEELAPLAGS